MPYPAGVVTRIVELPQINDFSGVPASGVLTITPSSTLKWAETGQIVLGEPIPTNIVGGTASVSLPIVQSGFVLSNNVRVDAFLYLATFSLPAGAPDIPDFWFILPAGDDDYQLDPNAPQDEVIGTVLTQLQNIPGLEGPAGQTPIFTIGTVTTGPVAAVSIDPGSTPENPILNFVLQPGPAGSPGSVVGFPIGGAVGQIAVKNSATDYDVAWANIPHELPIGGATGQVLAKISGTDYAVQWVTPAAGGGGSGVPAGGTTNQTLRKNSATDGDVGWKTDDYSTAPPGTLFVVKKNIATGFWPGGTATTWTRPSTRTDIFFALEGVEPFPPIVASGTGGVRQDLDYKWVIG